MNESSPSENPSQPETAAELSRRRFFARLSITLGGICAATLAIPLIGFVVAPFFRKSPVEWITAGKVDDFKVGQTVQVSYPDPSPLPWAGVTAKSAAWLRRQSQSEFIAFSVHCTHLGCPVRWLPNAKIFMCPCHGGVYYEDGTVAAGPPPQSLVRYDVRVVNGEVQIKSARIPITTDL